MRTGLIVCVGVVLCGAVLAHELDRWQRSQDGLTVRIPVLVDCESSTKLAIDSTPDRVKYSATYLAFDQLLLSHPNVVGFVEIGSSDYDMEFLTNIANGYVSDCHVDMDIPFRKDAVSDVSLLLRGIEASENGAIGTVYLLNNADSIRVLYRSKNMPRRHPE